MFESTITFAKQEDQLDPLRKFRDEFYFPQHDGRDGIYFCGNSLGLQPKNVSVAIAQELEDWRGLGVGGYRQAKNPWLYYQHQFCRPLASIIGSHEQEVTVMNSLTVNLHLMLLSFYHPSKARYKIMMEAGAFPSDQYAIETQLRFHGFDPDEGIIEVMPRENEKIIREEDILEAIETNRDSLALVLFGGINYYTGQAMNMQAIAAAAHQ